MMTTNSVVHWIIGVKKSAIHWLSTNLTTETTTKLLVVDNKNKKKNTF